MMDRMIFAAVFVSALKIAIIKGTLHVNAGTGSTESSCGTRTNPCKHLRQAIQRTKEGGEVIVHGVQTLASSIIVTKNVSIVGQEGATISRQLSGNQSSLVAFKVNASLGCLVMFNISNIRFNEIAMLSTKAKLLVRITNCTVHHVHVSMGNVIENGRAFKQITNKEVEEAVIQVVGRASGIVLEVINSTFIGWQKGYVIRMEKFSGWRRNRVLFDRCTFVSHLGIHIGNWWRKYMTLNVNNCVFIDMTCNSIYMKMDSRVWSKVFEKYLTINSTYLSITNSSFSNNTGCAKSMESMNLCNLCRGAIFAEGIFSIFIKDSIFNNCSSPTWGGALYADFDTYHRGTLVISRSVFQKNFAADSGADFKTRGYAVVIKDSIFAYSDGGSILIQFHGLHEGLFSNCTFLGNTGTTMGGVYVSKSPSKLPHSLRFNNCTFTDNRAATGGGAIALQLTSPLVVEIHSCTFLDNTGKAGGAVMIVMHKKLEKIPQLTIRDSLFERNNATVGGGVYVQNVPLKAPTCIKLVLSQVSVYVASCEFKNNSAHSVGQSIYSNDYITVEDSSIITFEKYVAPHLSLDVGNINLVNVTVTVRRSKHYRLSSNIKGIELRSNNQIKVTRGLTFRCPKNFQLEEVRKINEEISGKKDTLRFLLNKMRTETKYYYFSLDCKACSYDSYSLQEGQLYLPELSKSVPPKNNYTVQEVKCHSCPTGAICDVDVKAVDNYWGFKDSSTLTFILCPSGYCCGAETVPCNSIDTCAPGRTGVLCGSCAPGYKQNFVAGDCIMKAQKCDTDLFVTYFIIYTITYTLVFVLITNIKDILIRLKKKLLKKDPVIDSKTPDGEELSLAGFVQIVVLFFQVAGLLQVKFQGGKQKSAPRSNTGIREQISEIFNFRFTIYQQLCPSDDLTLPQKEWILFGVKMATFVHLMSVLLTFVLFKSAWDCLGCRTSGSNATSPEEPPLEEMSKLTIVEGPSTEHRQQQEVFTALSFPNMIKCTFIKLLKMYYAPVTKFALTMLHCISIRDTSHLYVYGDHVCYSSWQFAIMFVILPGLLMFPISFEAALRLFKEKVISSWQFVGATACPFYSVYLFFWNRRKSGKRNLVTTNCSGNSEEDSFRQVILEGEEMLFKETKGRTPGWQIVQFYRTFAITFLSTFFINPVYRQLAYIVLLLVFIVHDGNRKPYKNQYLNLLQSLTSRCLLLVLVCNIIPAMSYLVNVRTIPGIYEVVDLLGVIELIVYAIVPLSLPVWKLKIIIDNRQATKNK